MILKRNEGCTNIGYLTVNNVGLDYLTEEQKQNVGIKLLETLSESYSESSLYELINFGINTFGHYNYLYHCEQCGDEVGESVVEI